MAKRFRQGWSLIKNIYFNAEKAVIGNVILHTPNTYEQAKLKLIFDYAFFYATLLLFILFINMLSMNRVNMILIPIMIGILIGCLLLLRKGMVTIACVKLNNIAVYVSPGYSPAFQYLANPLIVGMYLLFLIRALGQYYRNMMSLEQKMTAEKQQQHLSLINQHLTKQFLLVKGFSRSGKSAFLKGETEFLEACFTEIEKQCGTAIDFLNEPGEM